MKRKLSKILGIALSIALLTSLLVAAVPVSAISDAEVAFPPFMGDDVISTENATYKITFELGRQLTSNATVNQSIIITFPDEYTLEDEDPNTYDTATLVAGYGWVDQGSGANQSAAIIDSYDFAANNSDKEIIITFGHDTYIGESAEVRIEIPNGIKNPDTPDSYQLTIQTWNDTLDVPVEDAVETELFAIVEPYITPLSGIALAYNKEGILMLQSHYIAQCIAKAGVGGRVEVGPGSYDETLDANVAGQTIVGTGEAGTVIITDVDANGVGGTLSVSAGEYLDTETGVTIEGLTFATNPKAKTPPRAPITIEDSAEYVTITDCDITSGTHYGVELEASDYSHAISNCTITAESTKYEQTAIMADAVVAVTDCTITVGAKGTAITSTAGENPDHASTKVKGTTITGNAAGSAGVEVTGCGVATIDGSTLQSLDTALYVDATKVTLKNSIVDTCGAAKLGKGDAIYVTGGNTTTFLMYNNTVQNTAELNWALNIGSGVANNIHFNNILNNTQAIKGPGVGGNYTHNWWGSADGPGFDENEITGGPPYKFIPLGSSVESASLAVSKGKVSSLDTQEPVPTVGIVVDILDDDGNTSYADLIGVAKYTGNPESVAPSILGTGSVLAYYDVYVVGVSENVRLKIYGAPSKYTKLYYAGGISGTWDRVLGTNVNTSKEYLYVTIGDASEDLIPSDLSGTAFALVEDKTAMNGPSIDPGDGSPTIGAYDVPIEPMFTWAKIDEDGIRAIRYEVALSEDPTFTIIEWSYNVDETFYKVDEPLRYDTTYYWRVRGVLGEPYQENRQWMTPATPWTVGIFTTESEPEPAPDPIVVNPVKPEVNVEIPPTKITIEPSDPAIPNYMLWIIVAVGAVLIIALIVLIVRTRRVV
jgi:hypothetical protein